MKIKDSLLSILLVFLGSGLLWGQTQENYMTYEGFEYAFVDIQKGNDGYIYCVGRSLDFNSVYDYKMFVLNEDLELEYVSEQQMAGPIGLRRTGDSILMATYDNTTFDFTISVIQYQAGRLLKDTSLSQNIVVYDENDSTETNLFGFIQLKLVDGRYTGLIVKEGTTAGRPPRHINHYFIESSDHTLTLDRLENYQPFLPPPVRVSFAFDFTIYQDSLFLLRSMSSASIYDKEWNLVGGRFKPGSVFNPGFILDYGNAFMSFGRVRANSGNPLETVPIISFLDDDFSVIRVDSFWSANERWFGIPSWYGGLISDAKNDTFFACASQGYHSYFNFGAIDTSAQVYVRAYGDQMNNLWELIIGDTLVHVSILKMERMPNGNLMLIGAEGSPATKYKFRPLIIEIDPNGTIVSTTNPVPVQSMDISLYPNPAMHRVTVDWKGEDSMLDLKIVNASGQQVLFRPDLHPQSTLDVGGLPPGMYYITLWKDGRMLSSKPFVKGGR